MTHFSDFSYLQRCGIWVYMGSFLLIKVWKSDNFKCLHPKKLLDGELRTIITVMYILMLLMQASWDVVLTWIKYSESYIVIPGTTTIAAKPFEYWATGHKAAAQSVDYVECVNLSMQAGVLILLQCFWNYLSNKVAKRSFMTSLEFKFYIIWAIGSGAAFPVLQYAFRNSELLRETVPLLAYAVEGLIIASLGIRSHRRFRKMIEIFRNLGHNNYVVERLTYFQEMNMLLSVVLGCYALTLSVLCIDALTPETIIAKSKIGTDFLMANCNTCAALMWVVGIFIFHPRRTKEDIESDELSRLEESHTRKTEVNTALAINCTGEDSKTPKESEAKETHRPSSRVTNFVNGNKITDLAPYSNNIYTSKEHPTSKEMISRIIHSRNLPVRTSSRAHENVPDNIVMTPLSPPKRSSPPRSTPSPDKLLRSMFLKSRESFNLRSASTVSAYGSYKLNSTTQENFAETIDNNQPEEYTHKDINNDTNSG